MMALDGGEEGENRRRNSVREKVREDRERERKWERGERGWGGDKMKCDNI